jgi:hypothetical protein
MRIVWTLTTVSCLVIAAMAADPPSAPAKKPVPDPIPKRWLLKLTPKELPKLPAAFSKITWAQNSNPRDGGGWTEWFAFAPDAGEVTVTRQRFRFPGVDVDAKGATVRTAPLAVHGPLVEFDRKLFTVALSEWKSSEGKVTPLLNLGAAVEVRPNVWYQAFSDEIANNKVRVTELLAEFVTDPRTQDEGKVTVRKHLRMLDEMEGEATEFEGTFAKKKLGSRTGVEVAGFAKKSGAEPAPVRLWLQQADDEVPAKFNLAQTLRLAAASEPAPKPQPAPGLVQPPKKPRE